MTHPMPANAPELMDQQATCDFEKSAALYKGMIQDAHQFIQAHGLWSVYCREVLKVGV